MRLANLGLIEINDLLSENGGFVNMEDLLMKDFAINDIFLIVGIINSLPILWRKELKNFKKSENNRKI